MRDAISEGANGDINVIRKARGEIAVGPAAGVFQFLRKVPMIEGAERADLRFEESIGEALVEVEAFGIGHAGTVGLDAGPGDGETVTGQVQSFEKRDVFLIAMVGITGNVAGSSALHFAGSVREAVPYGFALAVFGPGTFDLIGSCSRTPNKIVGKLERRELRRRFEQLGQKTMARRQYGKRGGSSESGGEEFTAIETVPSAHRLPPRL